MAAETALIKRLRLLAREIPSQQEILRLLHSLQAAKGHAADRAAGLVGATLIESALEAALLAKFLPLEPLERKKLFSDGGNGPLATLAARIRVGHAIGLYGQKPIQTSSISKPFATHLPTAL